MNNKASDSFVLREDCPQRRIHYVLNGKWTSMVLYSLSFGVMRTGQLERALPGISKKMLTQTLREVESLGLVHRDVFNVVPPKVEYSLTPLGKVFIEPLQALYDWAAKNADALDKLEFNMQKSQD
ncbi:helix-turn-helix transcriptional regulator [Acinetobacter vivianii]|uniref:winged helix-turn-helix transcriptional regulator n=1 Tax=Acinetobacter vivianii TaxID=1776742 RepID=UPI002DB87905|nr:helix-turn-helix domain-containing protein [Acinetobacter vivianii]MEB6666845.1 helix-turn-helix transcriptional regulator [Acinetobacter vivianii]